MKSKITLNKTKTIAEQKRHIEAVQDNMQEVLDDLVIRQKTHDETKLMEPELSLLSRLNQEKQAEIVYNSDEYHEVIKTVLKDFLYYHYKDNDHHPEHSGSIDTMPLPAILEMLCDWKAASGRNKNGSFEFSLSENIKRFKINDQLASILRTTAKYYGWL